MSARVPKAGEAMSDLELSIRAEIAEARDKLLTKATQSYWKGVVASTFEPVHRTIAALDSVIVADYGDECGLYTGFEDIGTDSAMFVLTIRTPDGDHVLKATLALDEMILESARASFGIRDGSTTKRLSDGISPALRRKVAELFKKFPPSAAN